MIIGLQLNYMKFYSAFYQNNVFPIALIIWTFLSLIYMIITCNKKPAYMKEIERIRNHKLEEDWEANEGMIIHSTNIIRFFAFDFFSTT